MPVFCQKTALFGKNPPLNTTMAEPKYFYN